MSALSTAAMAADSAGLQVWGPALLIAIGFAGIIVPVLPGLFLTLVAVLLWAWSVGSVTSWVVFAVCCLWFVAGLTGQWLLPGRRLKAEGVSTWGLLIAVAVGIVGFFVVPVVGFFLGFVLALFLLAYLPARDGAAAWRRTKAALKAILTSMGIELLAALAITLTWIVGLLLTA